MGSRWHDGHREGYPSKVLQSCLKLLDPRSCERHDELSRSHNSQSQDHFVSDLAFSLTSYLLCCVFHDGQSDPDDPSNLC